MAITVTTCGSSEYTPSDEESTLVTSISLVTTISFNSDDTANVSTCASVESAFSEPDKSTLQEWCENMNEIDILDIQECIYSLVDEYSEHRLIYLFKEDFYDNMCSFICDILLPSICEIINNDYEDDTDADAYDELRTFIEMEIENYKYFSKIPPRSEKTTPGVDTDDELTWKIAGLIAVPQPEQRTDAWYAARHNMLSASTLWKVVGSDAQKNSLIYEKCKPLEVRSSGFCNTASAMHWGVKYEPLTVMIYEAKHNTKIGEFGCIKHPKYDYIGASPDGIVVTQDSPLYGRMIEIKNIVNREITGRPKQEYWVQTQIQMEACDLNECDFVETRFKEYENQAKFMIDTTVEYKGVILVFIEHGSDGGAPHYIYKPFDIGNTQDEIREWMEEQKNLERPKNRVLLDVHYWYLDEYSCVLVRRNRQWFNECLPYVTELWNTIVKERVDGYEHRAARKRTPKKPIFPVEEAINVVQDDISKSYMIQNMPLQNTINMVRIDEHGNVL